jgi:hypothetical protein
MIVDCEYHHMTEREFLSYIRRQFGKTPQFMESSIHHQLDRKY